MVAVYPAGTKVQGAIKVLWVPTVANIAAPKLTEANAAGSLDISCFLSAGSFSPTVEQAKGTSPARLCTRDQFEQFGKTTYSMSDLVYVYNPQGAAQSNGMLAYEKLIPGTSGFFFARFGLDATTTDFAIGQFISVWPVTLGDRNEGGDTTDEFAEFLVTQPVIVTGPRTARVALVA